MLAVRRFGMPLQAAAGLVTLQGAVFVATLFLGGRWLSQRTHMRKFNFSITCVPTGLTRDHERHILNRMMFY